MKSPSEEDMVKGEEQEGENVKHYGKYMQKISKHETKGSHQFYKTWRTSFAVFICSEVESEK